MATIYDIAKLSNTSIATVSYVLNGTGNQHKISKERQELIMEVARSLNYRPNTSAKRLSMSDKQNISIVLFWPNNIDYDSSSISFTLAVKAFALSVIDAPEIALQFYTIGRLSDMATGSFCQRYHGIIIVGAGKEDLDYLENNHPRVPVVLINRILQGYPSVCIDSVNAGRMAADCVFQAGKDSLFAIWEHQYHIATSSRTRAFLDRCSELGISMEGRQFHCDTDERAGYNLAIRMIQKKELAKVIFCNHESVAIGFISALNECGYTAGKDLYVLTTNVGPANNLRYYYPSITSIDLKMKTVFEQGLKLCLDIITHRANEENEAHILLQPEIVYHDSLPLL